MPICTGTTVVAVHVVAMTGERKGGAASRTGVSAGMHITTITTTVSVVVIVGAVAAVTITITKAAVIANRRYAVVM